MGDVLRYRIPGKNVVRERGFFKQFEGEMGFVVTSFNKEKKFVFVPEDNEPEFHEKSKPIETSKEQYFNAANEVISELKLYGGKAILSRIKREAIDESPEILFEKLVETYPKAFVYLISSNSFGTWLGATPENLISRLGILGQSMALAGTRKTNEERSWTSKELEEHEIVADFIAQTLKEVQVEGIQRFSRENTVSGPVEHLLTRFQFELNNEDDWKLATKLHPTPAVSGFPREKALELIRKTEAHDRSLYAGIIGVVGDETHLFVNLRCAQIVGNEMFLYLGGGYTKDSVAEDEWMETENKAKTLLNLLKKE